MTIERQGIMRPKISVITPYRNGSNLFTSTYSSVICQTEQDFEWLIIDDASRDEESDFLRRTATDERVNIFHSKRRLGPGAARNIGLAYARGEYITFIDADDLWDCTFLEQMLRNCTSDRPFVFSGYRRELRSERRLLSDFIPRTIVTHQRILRGCDISCLTAFFDAKLLNNTITFGEIPARNDLVFFYRLLQFTDAFPLEMVLATYRISKRSVSANKIRALRYQYYVSRKVASQSIVKSVFNCALWAAYGMRKYGLE
jgi:glycosyltransferase involved in cell wall biosynthesis